MVVLREDFREGERRKPRVGDSVWQNQPLLYLPDLTRMQVLTQVREVDVHLVQPGHHGTARVDAYPSLQLPATVQTIGVLASKGEGALGGEKAIRVTIALEDSDPRLRPGMTARVDLLSRRVEDALVVPIQSVWGDGDEAWCWVHGPNGFGRRAVRVGARSRHEAEILEGLAEGERVALAEPLE